MNILMITPEMNPFMKAGGLADVVGALPRTLQARGHNVWVVMPRYAQLRAPLSGPAFHAPMGVKMGGHQEWCAVHRVEHDGVSVFFVEHDGFFGRWGLYHDANFHDYSDNPSRFSFLCRAALQLCLDQGFRPDAVHVHDWQTTAAIAYLRLKNWEGTVLHNVPTVLTLHNTAYQGIYPASHYNYLDFGWEHFHPGLFESYGAINLLKGGIVLSDVVTTVSPTYAHEILSGQGNGMEGYLAAKHDRFVGILNGVDYAEWSPETDRHLPRPYSVQDLSGKRICKRALQERFGLAMDDGVALLGVVGRLVDQKGLHLLAEILPRLLATMHLQVVLLGSGEKYLEHFFGTMAAHYPDRVATYFGFSEPLAHLIEAGCDFFLMPSLFEPCGLNQMYSMRYGTLPIVRATGGLNDTVDNYREDTGQGTGYKFHDPTGSALYNTIGWAISTFYDRPWHQMQMIRQAMERRFDWDQSAAEYEEAYRLAGSAR